MKKYILSVLAIAGLASCSGPSQDYSVVTGKISNFTGKRISIFDRTYGSSGKTTIDAEGNFVDTLAGGDNYILFDGKNECKFYVEKGQNLQINYDINKKDSTITFAGDNSAMNEYFVNNYAFKISFFKDHNITSAEQYYTLSEGEFVNLLQENKDGSLSILSSTKDKTTDFEALQKSILKYEYLKELSTYKRGHIQFSGDKNFKVSGSFKKEFEGLTYDKGNEYLRNSDYRMMVQNHYGDIAAKLSKDEGLAEDLALIKVVATIKNDTIKNKILERIVGLINHSENPKDFYNAFKSVSDNKELNAKIDEVYASVIKLAKGAESPKFVGLENYKGGTSSLDDFKGKYVYIDVWATWCGPCKSEIPHLIKLEDKYHGKNIVFVSLSVDQAGSNAAWRKMIVDKKMKGVQLCTKSGLENDFVKAYAITSIPRFILIDPKGKIVSGDAPRPSSKEIITLFNELGI